MSEVVGVLEAERRRQQMWADLGLPDPIRVKAEEDMTRLLYGPAHWRHPKRALLADYLEQHPEFKPTDW